MKSLFNNENVSMIVSLLGVIIFGVLCYLYDNNITNERNLFIIASFGWIIAGLYGGIYYNIW